MQLTLPGRESVVPRRPGRHHHPVAYAGAAAQKSAAFALMINQPSITTCGTHNTRDPCIHVYYMLSLAFNHEIAKYSAP